VETQRRQPPRTLRALRQTPSPPTPEGEARHEHRQDGRDERRDDAELRHRDAQPDDLVHEAAESGHEEEREEPAPAQWILPGGGCIASPLQANNPRTPSATYCTARVSSGPGEVISDCAELYSARV